ncbi:MAG: hypothetical protein HC880_03310 [Bacteroidia bacterium]|nr:hypothetical protein [Bacteroidia bacterium]
MKLLFERLKNADPASNPNEALDLINKILDEVEDAHSGVPKNLKAHQMPNIQDGRMYGILDDKFVVRYSDGGLRAFTRKNVIMIDSNGGFKIYARDRTSGTNQTGKLLFQKHGKIN